MLLFFLHPSLLSQQRVVRALALCLVLGLVFGLTMHLAGCASTETSTSPATSNSSGFRYDSLLVENERLRARNRELSDSLQFYDNIASGQYRRERRAMQDDLTRLAYELSLLREGGQTVATLSADVLFEPGTSTLTEDGRMRLRELARRLRTTYRDRAIRVEGHTDTHQSGNDAYASARVRSATQAAAVVDLLVAHSELPSSQFQAVALGDAQPTASNETETGRTRNRRIRIAVLPPAHDVASPFEVAW
ncbi:MAG: OmpA family protein [Longimonas sp.]|uniref:OmpA/MotB family protein n=1 Tax=Longimonas sp. TaxID=2039626 RepID=UPI003348CF0F